MTVRDLHHVLLIITVLPFAGCTFGDFYAPHKASRVRKSPEYAAAVDRLKSSRQIRAHFGEVKSYRLGPVKVYDDGISDFGILFWGHQFNGDVYTQIDTLRNGDLVLSMAAYDRENRKCYRFPLMIRRPPAERYRPLTEAEWNSIDTPSKAFHKYDAGIWETRELGSGRWYPVDVPDSATNTGP